MKRLIKKLTALAVMVAVTMSLVPSAFAYHTRAHYEDGFRVVSSGGGGETIQFPIYNPLPVDVPETHWAKEAISIVINTDPYPLFLGCEQIPNYETGRCELVIKEMECDMMNGYEDGTFRPDNSMTKLEFIKVLGTNFAGYKKYDLSSDEYKFYEQLNVPEWASDSMRNLCVRNIVDRTDTDLVNYNEPITRAEIAKLISRLASMNYGPIDYADITLRQKTTTLQL